MYVFLCSVSVNKPGLPDGTVFDVGLQLDATSIESVIAPTFSLFEMRKFGNSQMDIGWSKHVLANTRGILVTARDAEHAASLAKMIWQYFRKVEARTYSNPMPTKKIPVWTIAEFDARVREGTITQLHGVGYWCKDGKKSDDEVFETEQLDATHVVWFKN